jgi:hypothetical protein
MSTPGDSTPFGLPGLALRPGDHICALYSGDRQRDAVLLPFLRAGLQAGQWCCLGITEDSPSRVLTDLGPEVDLAAALATNQLMLRGLSDEVSSPASFSVAGMIEFWEEAVAEPLGSGAYSYARLTAEAKWWAHQVPSWEAFVEYEIELNRFTTRHPLGVLCLYDFSTDDSSLLINLVNSHPRILVGGVILENPYYTPPADRALDEGSAYSMGETAS